MNRRLVFVVAVLVALMMPFMLAGQDKKAGGKMDKKMDAGPTSVTGCLNKGADATHFVIKDDKGKETTVTGDAALKLDVHAKNHNVTLTGTMAKDGSMTVTDLKMNSMCK